MYRSEQNATTDNFHGPLSYLGKYFFDHYYLAFTLSIEILAILYSDSNLLLTT